MKNTYLNLIEQSYPFPQEGFDLQDGYLTFNGVSIKDLIERYGTPFKLICLPRIGEQIKKSNTLFNNAIKANKYSGKYHYCYCTKCNHFNYILSAALKHKVDLETSSPFDIDIILNLFDKTELDKSIRIIHNGYKTSEYIHKILELLNNGFTNTIIILDNIQELERLQSMANNQMLKIGIRMAVNEETQSGYSTSRLGIQANKILNFYRNNIKGRENIELKMFHFFIDSGIKDTLCYWGEFQGALKLFVELKKECPNLDSLNLGGGFPIKNHLGFEYNYEYIVNKIVKTIKHACDKEGIQEPDIYTEFGKYTVGESSANIYEVVEQKQQKDTELWYIVNNSLINTIPDAWAIHEKFILFPVNKWDNEYTKVNIGGVSCDRSDYYSSEDFIQQPRLPKYSPNDKEPLYIGFFHTGAYQDSISGYGGLKHCLIPSPKQVIIDRDESGNLVDYVYRNELPTSEMFKILGYEEGKKKDK